MDEKRLRKPKFFEIIRTDKKKFKKKTITNKDYRLSQSLQLPFFEFYSSFFSSESKLQLN